MNLKDAYFLHIQGLHQQPGTTSLVPIEARRELVIAPAFGTTSSTSLGDLELMAGHPAQRFAL